MSLLRNSKAAFWSRPLRFLVVGCANTAVGLGVIYFAKFVLRFDDVAANAAGFACGLSVSYVLNSTWTFEHGRNDVSTVCRFLVAFAVSYAANLCILWYSIERASMNSYMAQATALLVYVVCFYLLSKLFVFGSHGNEFDADEGRSLDWRCRNEVLRRNPDDRGGD